MKEASFKRRKVGVNPPNCTLIMFSSVSATFSTKLINHDDLSFLVKRIYATSLRLGTQARKGVRG